MATHELCTPDHRDRGTSHEHESAPVPAVPGRSSGVEEDAAAPGSAHTVQRRTVRDVPADVAADPGRVRAAAARGTQGAGSTLPFFDRIQRAFGRHDVSAVRTFHGDAAASASRAMGAVAFATGDRIAFGESPSLETVAHEAAHVVQQRGGLHIHGGVGQTGDAHERAADAVAARVIAGQSAEDLLDGYAPSSAPSSAPATAIQHRKIRTGLLGEIVTEELERPEMIAIYKQLQRVGGNTASITELEAAIEKREYKGGAIDLAAERERMWVHPRSLNEIIEAHLSADHKPDPRVEHTVGMEVEFGYHENPLLNFTHIEIARGRKINNLPFKLESDSGSTVEIVTPPFWITAEEEPLLKSELEKFAKESVAAPTTLADWVNRANRVYPMQLLPVSGPELRAGVNMYNLDEGCDIKGALAQKQSPTVREDVGKTVLSASKKDPNGAHTQVNKAMSLAEYGEGRAQTQGKIREDLAPLTEDRDLLRGVLQAHGLWDDAFAKEDADINAINAAVLLAKRKMKEEAPDDMSTAYLWESHMQCVSNIFRAFTAAAQPSAMDVAVGPDNSSAVCTLLGEKAVTGALAAVGENLELILQKNAWENKDPSMLKVQEGDDLTRQKGKAMAVWHTHVKDITGSWFKGDLRQVLLNERVDFAIAQSPGALEKAVVARWESKLAMQLIPYRQILQAQGVTLEGDTITKTSEAWLKLPLPDPFLYVREWRKALVSICTLVDAVAAERKKGKPDASFKAPGFLHDIDKHAYNGREDTMIDSQVAPNGEHQYVVEKR